MPYSTCLYIYRYCSQIQVGPKELPRYKRAYKDTELSRALQENHALPTLRKLRFFEADYQILGFFSGKDELDY